MDLYGMFFMTLGLRRIFFPIKENINKFDYLKIKWKGQNHNVGDVFKTYNEELVPKIYKEYLQSNKKQTA